MKKLLFSVLAFWAFQNASAQISITKENYNLTAGSERKFSVMQTAGVMAPMGGENRMWDYSALQPAANTPMITDSYAYADNPLYFPTAQLQAPFSSFVLGLTQSGFEYSEIRPDGLYRLGRHFNETSASLAGGLANLTLPAQNVQSTPPTRVIAFPMQYGAKWKTDNVFTSRLWLTSAPFGYNNAPVRYVQHYSYRDTIIGWGTLKTVGGGNYQVLLEKRWITAVDSYYVNNLPAPAQLLQALGITNGQTSKFAYYLFQAANNPGPVLTFAVNPQTHAVTNIQQNMTPMGCMAPMSVNMMDRTTTTLSLNWEPVNGAVRYQVNYRKKGTSSTSVRIANSPMLMLENLMPGATYQISVQTICANGVSEATQISEFATRLTPCMLNFSDYTVAASCNTCMDGRIEITPSNGLAPYMYRLNDQMWQSNFIYTGLAAGSYNVTVKDNDGCYMMKTIMVPVGTCPQPTGLTVGSLTPTSANVMWNGMSGAARYQVRYRRVGSSVAQVLTRTSPMASLSGLMSGTSYVVEVRSECGPNGNSTYASRAFTTPMAKTSANLTNAQALSLSVYPNPAREAINLSFDVEKAGEANVSLVDVTGRTAVRRNEAVTAGRNELSLDLDGVAPGVYFLRVQNGTVFNTTKIVVK